MARSKAPKGRKYCGHELVCTLNTAVLNQRELRRTKTTSLLSAALTLSEEWGAGRGADGSEWKEDTSMRRQFSSS